MSDSSCRECPERVHVVNELDFPAAENQSQTVAAWVLESSDSH